MTQTFKLQRIRDITPSCGEDLGGVLANAAERVTNRLAKAQMLYLAADAFEQGASASIGHGRASRYLQAASGLRQSAEQLEAEVKAERDEAEAKRLLHAFEAGWLGTDENFSFDGRDAYIVGKHFRKVGLPVAKSVRRERPQVFIVDGVKWVVIFPDGKINKAIVDRPL